MRCMQVCCLLLLHQSPGTPWLPRPLVISQYGPAAHLEHELHEKEHGEHEEQH